MKHKYVKNRDEWRDWLSKNHEKENELWLLFYKKETGQTSIPYAEAVEEALCFGWIDSIIKKIDDTKYVRKFTPRNVDSYWSKLNKKRAEKMIEQGKMTEVGLAKIEKAKESGLWDKEQPKPEISFDLPVEFEAALKKNVMARTHFEKLAPSHRKQYILWIKTAKRQETKQKRVRESIKLLTKGEKLGLK